VLSNNRRNANRRYAAAGGESSKDRLLEVFIHPRRSDVLAIIRSRA
jgi:hypothetical protein